MEKFNSTEKWLGTLKISDCKSKKGSHTLLHERGENYLLSTKCVMFNTFLYKNYDLRRRNGCVFKFYKLAVTNIFKKAN